MTTALRNNGEIACALALAVTGAAFAWSAWQLPAGDPGIPGPGAAPFALAAVLAAFGLASAFRAARKQKASGAALDANALLAILLIAMACIIFESAGFVLASTLFLVAGFRLLGGVPLLASVTVAITFSLAVHFVFVKALGVALPGGILAPLLGS